MFAILLRLFFMFSVPLWLCVLNALSFPLVVFFIVSDLSCSHSRFRCVFFHTPNSPLTVCFSIFQFPFGCVFHLFTISFWLCFFMFSFSFLCMLFILSFAFWLCFHVLQCPLSCVFLSAQ